MSVQSQMDEGDRLVGTEVMVAMRPHQEGVHCWVLCRVLRYAAGMHLELEVQPVAGTGTLRVRSWMPVEE